MTPPVKRKVKAVRGWAVTQNGIFNVWDVFSTRKAAEIYKRDGGFTSIKNVKVEEVQILPVRRSGGRK